MPPMKGRIMRNAKQVEWTKLQRDTAAQLDTVLAEDGMQSLPDHLYYRASRQRNGHMVNWLAEATVWLESLSADSGALLLSALEDVFEDCHGGECPDLRTAMQTEAEADAAEDEMQVRAAMDPAAFTEFLARSRRQEAAGRMLRRAVMAEHRRNADPRRTPRRAPTTRTEARKHA